MRQEQMKLWSSLFQDLEKAAIHFNQRDYFLIRALNKYIVCTEAVGVAIIRGLRPNTNLPDICYVGVHKITMEKWLQERSASTVELTAKNIKASTDFLNAIQTEVIPYNEDALFVVWHTPKTSTLSFNNQQRTLEYLQAIAYIEKNESLYFYKNNDPFDHDLAQSIQYKDADGLSELLFTTKVVSQSDFVFWGDANSSLVEITSHLGSLDSRFGFELPMGHGIGGQVAQNQNLIQVNDYRNCAYRYNEVSSAVDGEDVRSVLALPIKDYEAHTSGVLYVSNRHIKPFSLHTKLMLLRLGQGIEPLTKQRKSQNHFMNNQHSNLIQYKKKELRKLTEHARKIDEITSWLAEFLNGKVVTEHTRTTSAQKDNKQLRTHRYSYPINQREQLVIYTDQKLPLLLWPDLIEDVLSTISIVTERETKTHHLLELERSQWIENILHQTSDEETLYDRGLKLQVPVDQGEVWAIYWEQEEELLTLQQKIALEEVVIKWTKNPLYFSGNMAFILFGQHPTCQAEMIRNELLNTLPVVTRIIHQATYQSFQQLQDNIIQLQRLLKQMSTMQEEVYVIAFSNLSLDYLLTNQHLSTELFEFAESILAPLTKYDEKKNTQLTTTLSMSLVYQSPKVVAKHLYIHPNTVHYRVKRAKELIQLDLTKPENNIALQLSAYTWLYHHQLLITSTS